MTTTHDNIKILVEDENVSKPLVPLTGADVAQMFAERRNAGKWEQYFLKEVEGDSYRYSSTINRTDTKCSWPLVDMVPLELKTLVVSPQTVRPAGGRLQDSWLCALHLLSQHGHMCDGQELRRTRQPVRVVQGVLTVEGSPEDSLFQGLQAAESFHLVSRSEDQLLFGLTSRQL